MSDVERINAILPRLLRDLANQVEAAGPLGGEALRAAQPGAGTTDALGGSDCAAPKRSRVRSERAFRPRANEGRSADVVRDDEVARGEVSNAAGLTSPAAFLSLEYIQQDRDHVESALVTRYDMRCLTPRHATNSVVSTLEGEPHPAGRLPASAQPNMQAPSIARKWLRARVHVKRNAASAQAETSVPGDRVGCCTHTEPLTVERGEQMAGVNHESGT